MTKDLTIKALQKHIKEIDHTPEERFQVILKLIEEVGELSVEIRNSIAQGITEDIKRKIKYELYDIIHYVNHIANIYSIDLEEAIIEKDKINEKRYKESRRNK
ncbi:MAG: nucleotide pyrophosphohydrolase [Candidatus Izimaplasma sp.]|nr:nucleotide pyrophosphohydrolase [Candidatus Izimaplasma bacterium]